MPLTSSDIQQKQFTRGVRGYAMGQVDDFLAEVAEQVGRLHDERARLHDERARLQDELARLRESPGDHASHANEEAIGRALLKAQQIADQTVEEARSKAQAMLADAEARAAQVTEQARQRVAKMNEQMGRRRQELDRAIATLRGFERDYRVRLRGFVEDQLKLLEDATPADSLAPPATDLDALPDWDEEPDAATPAGADQAIREALEQLDLNGRKGAERLPSEG
jgi:DivIVA domain-containing protein